MGGAFGWYELLTTDLDRAAAFHREVLGWEVDTWGAEDYRVLSAGGRLAGGLRRLPEQARQRGAPANWLGHVRVADVEATVRTVETGGGMQLGPVQEIAGVGRHAVMRDGQRAVFGVLAAAAALPAVSGPMVWSELHTTDREAAWRLYGALFGWRQVDSHQVPPFGTYLRFATADDAPPSGGMLQSAGAQGISTHWLAYAAVAGLDEALERVRAGGGTVIAGPTELATGERIAQLEDPQGAALGLRQRPA
jgi:uncharacterized protein